LWTLQRACDVQLATLSMGPAIQISEDIAQKCTLDALQYYPDNGGGGGDDVFAAMQRLVDRIDDRYRL